MFDRLLQFLRILLGVFCALLVVFIFRDQECCTDD
jgi:hypothetical protein